MSSQDRVKESASAVGKHPKLRALTVACGCALFFFLMTPAKEAPPSLVGLFHGDSVTETDMVGGTQIDLIVEGDASAIAAVTEVLKSRGVTEVQFKAGMLRLELPEFELRAATVWASRMAAEGVFSLNRVINDSEFMRKAYALSREAGPDLPVQGDIDQWYHDESGTRFTDFYLRAPGRDELAQSFEAWLEEGALVLPTNTELAYEEVVPAHTEESYWRSYFIDSRKEITQNDVADAYIYWNPTMNKPEVLIEFTEEGGKRFGDLTAEIVGHKIAIVMDGEVNSAPTVQTAIYGGSSSISMGGNDSQMMQAEAQALANVLRAPPLPAPVSVHQVIPVSASVAQSSIVAARLLMAFGLGLLVFLVAWLSERATLANPLGVAKSQGEANRKRSKALKPLLITGGGAAAAYALSLVWLPGCKGLVENFGAFGDTTLYSLTTIGIIPFLVGAVLVDLVAWLVPGLRKHRSASAARRQSLDHAAMLLGMALLFAMAYLIAAFLADLGSGGGGRYSLYGAGASELIDQRYVLAALIAGSSLLYGIAKGIDRWGLGNGFAVVLAVSVIPELSGLVQQSQALALDLPGEFIQYFLIATATGLMTAFLVRRPAQLGDESTLSQPAAGIAPVLVGPALFALLGATTRVFDDTLLYRLQYHTSSYELLRLLGVVAFSVALTAFAFRRPAVSGQSRVVSGVEGVGLSRATLLAFAVSVAFPVALFFGMRRFADLRMNTMLILYVAFGTVIAMDLVGGFRARWRNSTLVAVWDLRRPRYLQPILKALKHADIEVFVRGRHFRQLLSVLGPFAPMVIMVPQDRASDAREIIEGQLLPARLT